MALGRSWTAIGGKGQALLAAGGALGAVLGVTLFRYVPGVMMAVCGLLFFAGLGAYLYFMLSGNKAEVRATPTQRATALSALPSPGAAKAIFYRDGFVGRMLGVQLILDGQPMVQMRSPRFAAVELQPGTHTLNAGASGFAASQVNSGAISFTVEPGQIIAFRIEVLLGALKNTFIVIPDPAPALLPSRLAAVEMVLAGPAGGAPAATR